MGEGQRKEDKERAMINNVPNHGPGYKIIASWVKGQAQGLLRCEGEGAAEWCGAAIGRPRLGKGQIISVRTYAGPLDVSERRVARDDGTAIFSGWRTLEHGSYRVLDLLGRERLLSPLRRSITTCN